MKKLIIASHTALIEGNEYDGIGNVLKTVLKDRRISYTFIRHSIDGKLSSVLQVYNKGELDKETKLKVLKKVSVFRYLTEFLAVVYTFSLKQKGDIFIGIDPLNAFSGIILKKLKRIDTVVFYTPDYSPKRFSSRLMNLIYHSIDCYCVNNADFVWSVSTRIQDVRRKMGLEDRRNILVPNVPPYSGGAEIGKRDIYRLTTNGVLGEQLDFEGVFKAIKVLSKEYPKITFSIIGSGPAKMKIMRLAKKHGVENKVILLGHLSLAKSLEETSKCGIGLALYTGVWGFNYYGDSTKCREFLYFGLPVITTDSHSTVDEICIEGAGVVVDKDYLQYVKALKNIFSNYSQFSKNAKRLGGKYKNIHLKLILDLIN